MSIISLMLSLTHTNLNVTLNGVLFLSVSPPLTPDPSESAAVFPQPEGRGHGPGEGDPGGGAHGGRRHR